MGPKKGSNAVKERVAVGHYLCTFFGVPTSVSMLELTDEKQSGIFSGRNKDAIKCFLDIFFPHPLRYRQVWRLASAMQPLHIWEPIPPAAEYVALGMVATTSDEPPAPSEVRCVPRPWAERLSNEDVVHVWAYPGNDRAPPASFWGAAPDGAVDGGAVLHASVGGAAHIPPEVHTMPTKKFYASLPLGL